jgi:hypothetical protein
VFWCPTCLQGGRTRAGSATRPSRGPRGSGSSSIACSTVRRWAARRKTSAPFGTTISGEKTIDIFVFCFFCGHTKACSVRGRRDVFCTPKEGSACFGATLYNRHSEQVKSRYVYVDLAGCPLWHDDKQVSVHRFDVCRKGTAFNTSLKRETEKSRLRSDRSSERGGHAAF